MGLFIDSDACLLLFLTFIAGGCLFFDSKPVYVFLFRYAVCLYNIRYNMLLCNAHDVIKMITAIFKREIDNETIEEEVSANLYTVTHYGKKIYSVGGYKYSGYYDNEKGIVIIDGNEVSDAIDYDDESDYYDNLYYADGY